MHKPAIGLLVVATALLAILSVGCQAYDDLFDPNYDYSPPTPTPISTHSLAPGDVLTFKDDSSGIHIELKALEVVRGYAGSDFWLDSGNEWVKVVIEVKNLSEDKYSSLRSSDFALVDTNYSVFDDTFGAPRTGNLIEDKEFAPRATVRGDVVLQAPISETFLALSVDPRFFDVQYLPLQAVLTVIPNFHGDYNVTVTREGVASALITWDPVPEAEYYVVFYDNFHEKDSCRYDPEDGDGDWCDELSTHITGTSYLDENPDFRPLSDIHYWVAACDQNNCTFINTSEPAVFPRR